MAKELVKVTEQDVERVWGPAIEDELYVEAINLRYLEMRVIAARNDYAKLCELKRKNLSIRDRDLRHAQRLIDVRLEAYEKELARLHGEGHFDEEEELVIGWETPNIDPNEPERQEELINAFSDINDPEDFHNPYPKEDDEGDDDDDFAVA